MSEHPKRKFPPGVLVSGATGRITIRRKDGRIETHIIDVDDSSFGDYVITELRVGDEVLEYED